MKLCRLAPAVLMRGFSVRVYCCVRRFVRSVSNETPHALRSVAEACMFSGVMNEPHRSPIFSAFVEDSVCLSEIEAIRFLPEIFVPDN